jgi:uncharacterized membrane protein
VTSLFSNRLLLAIIVTTTGLVLYHVVIRGARDAHSPLEFIMIAYLTGFTLVALLGYCTNALSIAAAISPRIFLRGIGLGVATVLIEIGYIYAYKRGLPITIGGLTNLAIATIVLAPIGVMFFKDPLTMRMMMGALVTVAGVWLMRS